MIMNMIMNMIIMILSNDLPNITNDESMECMTITIENVEAKGTTSTGIFINVMLYEIHTLNRIDNSKLIH